jgi:hypothetical protein
MLKALVIQDDKKRIKELGDLIAIARSEGKKIFKTKADVQVLEVFHAYTFTGYVVVVSYMGCTEPLAQEGEKEHE